MDASLWGQLLLILLLIIGNAYFVGAEVAITGARRSKIRQLADMGSKSAMRVQQLHLEPERFYSVTQIGITLVSLGLGAIGMDTLNKIMEPGFIALFAMMGNSEGIMKVAHWTSYGLSFAIISFLHVVGGELAPKILAFHKAEPLAMAVSWSVNFQYTLWRPVIWLMQHASNFLLFCVGQKDLIGAHGEHFSMTEEEIRTIIAASEGAGVLEPGEAKMITGVFDLEEHSVREAMIPRTDILALSKDMTVSEVLDVFKTSPHARFPVFDGSLDNIVGIVFMKEILSWITRPGELQEGQAHKTVSDIMRPPHLVPTSKNLSELLKEFRRNRQQMAIVVDEYGGTAGLITLEDILEEIVGEYEDEFTRTHRHIKKGEEGCYLIDASVRVSDLEASVDFPFPSGDYVTLAGLVYHILGKIPKVGEVVEIEGATLKVMEMDNHRITKVSFHPASYSSSENKEAGEAEKPHE
ncbi:MAG: HlyC/CorC family transporter [Magnetococcales bacterium]|nr:HlyC/CorC family transporter [Magnetococcales bacterium]NGZ28600.1 HlyC/CorC family transporter [Magnetococcales bacterium]